MVKRLYVLLGSVMLHIATWAGIVTGTVKDAETGEELPGATLLAENGQGTTTDGEGRYSISLSNGEHTLTVRYIGYESQSKEIVVSSHTDIDFLLKSNTNEMQTAIVTAELRHNTEAIATREQQEAHVTMTGVSEQQIRKTQDKNAGEVIRRIPGVSLIDEKFVMVRGLSQRYNNVWLNGAAVPSSEADQRAFSFDIIPSSQLDNLKVVKSSAPEYPADFSGGFILVNTKDVPTSNTWSIGLTGGMNTETHLQESVEGRDGRKAFQGIATDWHTKTSTPIANLGLSADLAQRWQTAGRQTFGLNGSLSYTNGYQTLRDMENNMFGAFDITHNRSNYLRRSTDQQYNNHTRLGAMLGLMWLPASKDHRIEFKQILNRITKDRYTYRCGYDAQSDYMEQAEYYYQSRLTYNLGLNGKHTWGEQDKMNWNLGYAYANRNLPDRKRYTIYEDDNDETSLPYLLVTQDPVQAHGSRRGMVVENLNDINRELSHLDEHILSGAANWQHQLNIGDWHPSLSTGGYAEYRGRKYTTRLFTYAWPHGQLSQAMRTMDVPTQLLTNAHYGPDGLYLIEQVDWSNNYEAKGRLASGYLSVHVPFLGNRVEAYGGVRFEHSQTELVSHTQRQAPSPISTYYTYNDFFPSLNLIAHTNKNQQLRLAYGRTTNRPEFRELSSSVYYDFDLASNVQGNHNLKPAYIDNLDLGWEWYPHAGEVVCLSLFYKRFSDPIEWTYTVAGGTDLVYSYLNAGGANNYGIEVDVRKQLDFLHLPQFSVSLNASWIKSKVWAPSDASDDESRKFASRPMQGQSPYLVNLGLFWNGDQGGPSSPMFKGWTASLLYNTIGKRLIGVGRSVGSGATEVRVPDSYEMPRHQIDINLGKQIGPFDLRLSVRDLLAQSILFKQFEKTQMGDIEQVTRSYRPGRTFTLTLAYKMSK